MTSSPVASLRASERTLGTSASISAEKSAAFFLAAIHAAPPPSSVLSRNLATAYRGKSNRAAPAPGVCRIVPIRPSEANLRSCRVEIRSNCAVSGTLMIGGRSLTISATAGLNAGDAAALLLLTLEVLDERGMAELASCEHTRHDSYLALTFFDYALRRRNHLHPFQSELISNGSWFSGPRSEVYMCCLLFWIVGCFLGLGFKAPSIRAVNSVCAR